MNLKEVIDKTKQDGEVILKDLVEKAKTIGKKEEKQEKELFGTNNNEVKTKEVDKINESALDLLHDQEIGLMEQRFKDCQDRLQAVEKQNKQLLDHFLDRDKLQTDSINKSLGALSERIDEEQ